MEGDLEDVLHEMGPRLPEKLVAAKIAFPILQALDYLHNMHGIIHRDVRSGRDSALNCESVSCGIDSGSG